MCVKKILNNDMYVAYPTIMDFKYWWIIEMFVGLLGIIGLLLMSRC